MAPLKSLEQLVPLAIFLGMQLLEYVEIERRKRRLSLMEVWALRIKLAVPCASAYTDGCAASPGSDTAW